VNHSTFLLQSESFNIRTDPVWSERVKSRFFSRSPEAP
jgi:L-ascorbate metabolism protein UlaG (beta-lactamase superfamily)